MNFFKTVTQYCTFKYHIHSIHRSYSLLHHCWDSGWSLVYCSAHSLCCADESLLQQISQAKTETE